MKGYVQKSTNDCIKCKQGVSTLRRNGKNETIETIMPGISNVTSKGWHDVNNHKFIQKIADD